MINSIFNYKLKQHEKGTNHLYDEIEVHKDKDIIEFTEDDLKTDNVDIDKFKSNEITPVKSIPKPQPYNKNEDLLNPYTNPNLDADLSATIGKLSKRIEKRKQINMNAF